MNPLVSVIIPAYNEEKVIQKTISSVFRSDYKNIEIIVVANGCTDNTERIVKYDKRIKLLKLDKPNVSRARNYGAMTALGDFFIFLDADTIISKNLISNFLRNYKKGNIVSVKATPLTKRFFPKFLFLIKNIVNSTHLYCSSNGIIIHHRDLFYKVRGFNEKIKIREDRFYIRSAMNYGSYKFLSKPYVKLNMRRYKKVGYINLMLFWLKTVIKTWMGLEVPQKYAAIR